MHLLAVHAQTCTPPAWMQRPASSAVPEPGTHT